MFNFRKLSQGLLVLEGLLLILPSFTGLMLLIYGFFYAISSSPDKLFPPLVVLLTGSYLFSFWYIFANAVNENFVQGKEINQTAWLLSVIGVVFSILSAFLFHFLTNQDFEFFTFGILYIPTYFHLLIEIKRQKGTVSFGNY